MTPEEIKNALIDLLYYFDDLNVEIHWRQISLLKDCPNYPFTIFIEDDTVVMHSDSELERICTIHCGDVYSMYSLFSVLASNKALSFTSGNVVALLYVAVDNYQG